MQPHTYSPAFSLPRITFGMHEPFVLVQHGVCVCADAAPKAAIDGATAQFPGLIAIMKSCVTQPAAQRAVSRGCGTGVPISSINHDHPS
jgi:hypothetical protein